MSSQPTPTPVPAHQLGAGVAAPLRSLGPAPAPRPVGQPTGAAPAPAPAMAAPAIPSPAIPSPAVPSPAIPAPTGRGVDQRIVIGAALAVVAVVVAVVLAVRPGGGGVTASGPQAGDAPAAATQGTEPQGTGQQEPASGSQTADAATTAQFAQLMGVDADAAELECLAGRIDPAWNAELSGGDYTDAAEVSAVVAGCVRPATLAASMTSGFAANGADQTLDLACVEGTLASADAGTWEQMLVELFDTNWYTSATLENWIAGCAW